MLRSMTGFGRARGLAGANTITVLIRCLNNKQLDLSVKTPMRYRDRENLIRDVVSSMLQRGKIDVSISSDQENTSSVSVNLQLAAQYVKELRNMASVIGVEEPANWIELLVRMPDVMGSGTNEADDQEWEGLLHVVREACLQADEYRISEAKALEKDLVSRLDAIAACVPDIEKLDPERRERQKERLEKELLHSAPDVTVDPARLEQELFYYLDKMDINEEKVRLSKHIEYFRETLHGQQQEPAGKKLAFIAQEMGREINTLGNKSNHFGIQRHVVVMKDELEKIKEQLANIL